MDTGARTRRRPQRARHHTGCHPAQSVLSVSPVKSPVSQPRQKAASRHTALTICVLNVYTNITFHYNRYGE
ncbi:hypothetical protein PUN4_100065 [Paraburkholderia unamae]|nr:hypothetical protein PUN4_100065 [Paraburkholderia unamae]